MNTKLVLAFLIWVPTLSVWRYSHADTRIGGNWHEEAMAAWKDFNHGKELPEEDLRILLFHGSAKDQDRYRNLACEKGAAGFCTYLGLQGIFKKDHTNAAKFYKRACLISYEPSDCAAGAMEFINAGDIQEAKALHIRGCINDDAMNCDHPWNNEKSKQDFIKMLIEACSDGHALSCLRLDRKGVQHKTPPSIERAVKDYADAKKDAEKIENGWDGKYENAKCSSSEECTSEAKKTQESLRLCMHQKLPQCAGGVNWLVEQAKLEVAGKPYDAKACSLGGASGCFSIAVYEEERGNLEESANWHRKSCEINSLTNYCMNAVRAKLVTGDLAVSTALFLKTCGPDNEADCRQNILDQCKNGQCDTKIFNIVESPIEARKSLYINYKKLLSNLCKEGRTTWCKLNKELK